MFFIKKIILIFSMLLTISSCSFVNTDTFPQLNVNTNFNNIKKDVFLNTPEIGVINGISYLRDDGNIFKPKLNIIGSYGRIIKNQRNNVFVKFPASIDRVNLSKLEVNKAHFVSYSSPPAIYDINGNQLWKYDINGQFMGMASGNVNIDKEVEFIIASKSWSSKGVRSNEFKGKLELLDSKGILIWKINVPEIWHVEMLDIDGDNISEIIYSDYDGKLTVLNGNGSFKLQYSNLIGRNFSIIKWPHKNSPDRFLVAKSNRILIYDLNGVVLAVLKAPGAHQYDISGISVELTKGKVYFASIVKSKSSSMLAQLYIYNDLGSLIYHEKFSALAPVLFSNSVGLVDELLVGGVSSVWRYKIINQINEVRK